MKRKFSLHKELKSAATAFAMVAAPLASTSSTPAQAQVPAQSATQNGTPNNASNNNDRFVPYSQTGEQCPVRDPLAPPKVWPTPSFDASPTEQQRLIQKLGMDIGREQPDGIFRERTIASVNEFRIFYYGAEKAPFAESLSPRELNDLREFVARVDADKAAHRGLSQASATALRFAAHATGADYAKLLAESNNGETKFVAQPNNWLWLVKNHGEKHGLKIFADQITQDRTGDTLQLSVNDGVALRLIMELQNHPRLSRVMQAEYIQHRAEMPALAYKPVLEPVANLRNLQLDLMAMGFDVMPTNVQDAKTEAALQKFETLYSFFGPADKKPYELVPFFADYARKEARIHGIPVPAAAAIRLGALRAEEDFGYLMELSAAESTFDHEATASTSSATGLYQFTEDTWLQTINRYGQKYGLEFLSDRLENKDDMNGLLVGRAQNPFLRFAAFDFRSDAQYAALMSAEFQMRNRFLIECAIGRVANRTEKYLGHFLGAQGAAAFLVRMKQNPNASAADMFPQAADANRSIFFSKDRRGRRIDRTLQGVYDIFSRKFNRDTYESNVSIVYPGGASLPRETTPPAPSAPLSPTGGMVQPLPPNYRPASNTDTFRAAATVAPQRATPAKAKPAKKAKPKKAKPRTQRRQR